ncbi:hypothetical protein MM221_11215 [Salipaludibacillus sp. LMS25]|uniref:hypothetical protein n=1 Tax=Salipaludibacillus sp. LMS25 TaxID=2924031 RepID=UPI0020D0D289|nr:hypothetical protein [Salipaludibacillus sp. LMS25]UTR13222.1 hypothetical protein MM221_11215 [Salipaludibacillus sp. LMS25]
MLTEIRDDMQSDTGELMRDLDKDDYNDIINKRLVVSLKYREFLEAYISHVN